MSAVANPFVVGGAINDLGGRGFYGRDEIFGFVRGVLTADHRPPILLIGQRRIGKSSILRQLPRHLPDDYVCVYYDLQGRAQLTLDEVLYGLGRAIADAAGFQRPTEEEATENTIDVFLERTIARLGGRAERLILLFDEFDVIDQQFAGPEIAARRFIPFLADLISRQRRIGYILVVGRRTEELSEGFFSSVLKDAVQKPIGRLQRSDTERMVTDAFGSSAVSDAALNAVANLTAGHPFCAQVLCYALWNYFHQGSARPVVEAEDVENALPLALEFGTLGLNWVYDGLEQTSHRLFLSALAELAGTQAVGTVSYDAIHDALFKRRLGVDENQLRVAPRDLRNWDVVEGFAAGFRFAVPMIGMWIQINRPLGGLEHETRLINPRAAKYQELAAESHQRGDYEAAIADYLNALAANPVYVDAQVGLATAFRVRNLPGDLEKAIEGFERVLDLDPNASRSPLLEVLFERMEGQRSSAKALTEHLKRIRELDSDGLFRDRATRLVEHMANVRLAYGTTSRLREAVQLFEATGNDSGAAEARRKFKRVDTQENISVGAWFALSALWGASWYFSDYVSGITPVLQLSLACASAICISINMVSEHDGHITFRRWGLVTISVLAALSAIAFVPGLRPPIGEGSVVAFFAVFILNAVLNPFPAIPAELRVQATKRTTSVRESIATIFDRSAKRLRAGRALRR